MRTRARRFSLYVLHRWIGVTCALVVLWLALSGYVLNHVSDWSLDRRHVATPWLLDAYGIDIAAPTEGFPLGDDWVSACAGTVYWNAEAAGQIGTLLGAARSGDLQFVLGSEAALLLDARGDLIERIEDAQLPAGARAVAASPEGFVIDTALGRRAAGPDLLQWTTTDTEAPPTVAAQPLPEALAQAIRKDARARELSWSRVLADLHSGRFFGRFGAQVMDLFALGLALLACSGLWMWTRHLRHQRRRRSARAAGPP